VKSEKSKSEKISEKYVAKCLFEMFPEIACKSERLKILIGEYDSSGITNVTSALSSTTHTARTTKDQQS